MNASQKTVSDRAGTLSRFAWWLEHEAGRETTLAHLNSETVRRFLTYCREARPDGRFGSSHPNAKKEARPSTVATAYRDLKTFTRFCVAEGLVEADPLRNLKAPRVPQDQLQPLDAETVRRLLEAVPATACPKRNRAIILTLLDSGMRLGELLSLRIADLKDNATQITIVGKGNKRRVVFLGKGARRALHAYTQQCRRQAKPTEPLFVSEGGTRAGTALTGSGLRQMLRECARSAGIERTITAHDFRRTFAISFLRDGGNLLQLQALLGHQDLSVVRRYVALTANDLEDAHRAHSPVDRLGIR